MLGEKDLIFLGAALIWAGNRDKLDTPNQAVHEAKVIFKKVFNDDED